MVLRDQGLLERLGSKDLGEKESVQDFMELDDVDLLRVRGRVVESRHDLWVWPRHHGLEREGTRENMGKPSKTVCFGAKNHGFWSVITL